MNEKKNTLLETVPAAGELRKVPGFNPMHYLRQTVSKTGEKVLKLELPYKKLWFRMACPNGRMLLNRLRITDQMAVIEAKVYADKDDPIPLASFTAMRTAKDVPGGQYLRAAQDEALNEVLENAGFGIQLCDVAQVSDGGGYGSEIPLSQVKAAVQNVTDTKPEKPVEEISQAAPAPASVASSDSSPVRETAVMEAVESPDKSSADGEAPADAEAPVPENTDAAKVITLAEPETAPVNYTEDMSVEEILQRMTLEDARKVVVKAGTCNGWTLGQVESDRPASLRWYVLDHSKVGNIVKAAAKLILDEVVLKKAG